MPKTTTRRRRRHNPLEFFETPPGFTRFLDRSLHIEGRIYCPTVGDGAIERALREHPDAERTFLTNDLDPARTADHHLDARMPEAWWFGNPEFGDPRFGSDVPAALGPPPAWVIDNPPFSAAYTILINALPVVRTGIALHLRVSFAEPTVEREGLLVARPPDALFYLPRFSFGVSPTTGKRSTDATTTAWHIWLTDASDHPFRDRRRILVAPRSVADEGWPDAR